MAGRKKGTPKTGGRRAGTPNTTTTTVKAALLSVFDDIGGTKAFATWARANPTEYYKLFVRLIPVEANLHHDGRMTFGELVEASFDSPATAASVPFPFNREESQRGDHTRSLDTPPATTPAPQAARPAQSDPAPIPRIDMSQYRAVPQWGRDQQSASPGVSYCDGRPVQERNQDRDNSGSVYNPL